MKSFYFFLLIAIVSCSEQNNSINWTSHSIYMEDTNIVIDLPNVIKLKSGIAFECLDYDPERLILNYTSIIDSDTAKIEISSVVKGSHGYLNNDTIILGRMVHDVRMFNRYAKIDFYETRKVNGKSLYIVKYTIENTSNYSIFYRHLDISILNLKDEKTLNKIINSFKFEESYIFMCW